MKRAIIFPGQGSQKIGMGKVLCETFLEAREVFQEIDDTLHQKLSALIFEGDENDLRLTENAQPALFAVSMAVTRVLNKQSGIPTCAFAAYAAGHSLGEYAALCAVRSLALGDAALLLRKRGQAMQQAVPVGIGGMAALIGADIDAVKEIAREAAKDQICAAANDNATGQIVISGHMEAIDRAILLAADKGFRRCVKLPVSAPFHCELMRPAADVMQAALAEVRLKMPCVPVIPNVSAQPTQDPEEIRRLLVEQVCGSVRWRESVLFMKEQGVEQLVECGSGSVLAGLARRIDKSLSAVSLETPEDIDKFVESVIKADSESQVSPEMEKCCML